MHTLPHNIIKTIIGLSLLIALGLALSGCETLGTVVGKGQEFNDAKIKAAKFVLCEESSIGAVRREFGDDPVAYNAMCTGKPITGLINK